LTFVDTNILLDLLLPGGAWGGWSLAALVAARGSGPLVTNDVVYAEVSMAFDGVADTDRFLGDVELAVERTPRTALFLAARAHAAYRKRGGQRTGVLPDFFIGAHAVLLGAPLLTRDGGRYRLDFPDLALLTP
jgi:predicted nucleic acid-binding protein